MYSYTELQSKFNHGSINKHEYKLENNTYVLKHNTGYDIQLHGSLIAYIDDRIIILDSCGWKTPTTKDRLNKILHDNETGYQIWQSHFNWYIWELVYPIEQKCEFYNGITFLYETSPLMGIGWRLSTE